MGNRDMTLHNNRTLEDTMYQIINSTCSKYETILILETAYNVSLSYNIKVELVVSHDSWKPMQILLHGTGNNF